MLYTCGLSRMRFEQKLERILPDFRFGSQMKPHLFHICVFNREPREFNCEALNSTVRHVNSTVSRVNSTVRHVISTASHVKTTGSQVNSIDANFDRDIIDLIGSISHAPNHFYTHQHTMRSEKLSHWTKWTHKVYAQGESVSLLLKLGYGSKERPLLACRVDTCLRHELFWGTSEKTRGEMNHAIPRLRILFHFFLKGINSIMRYIAKILMRKKYRY